MNPQARKHNKDTRASNKDLQWYRLATSMSTSKHLKECK